MWTGERLETYVEGRIAIEHLHRYSFALNYIENCEVLDIACGEGYGSNLMSKKAKQVYGVDINEDVVCFAKKKYKEGNLTFKVGSTSNIPLEDNSVDVITSFETIEHHDEHDEMMSELKRVLKPNGIIIISSPDKLYYSDKRNYKNRFHLKELYKEEFYSLVKKYFSNVELLSQTYINGVSLLLDDKNQEFLEIFSGDFSNVDIKKKNPMFLVALLSDIDFKVSPITVFEGKKLENKKLKNQEEFIKNTITFRLGKLILSPLRLVKRTLKI